MRWTVTKVLPINVATCWQAKYEASNLYPSQPFTLKPTVTKEYSKTEKTIWHIWCDTLNEHVVLAPTCIYDKVKAKYEVDPNERSKTLAKYARWNSLDCAWGNYLTW